MDTFCVVFKSLGDYLLYCIGLWIAVCAISPKFKAWFKSQEHNVMSNRRKSISLGISLAAFCLTLIAVSVRIQLVQAKQQSPVYQQQITLKHETEMLAKWLRVVSPRLDATPPDFELRSEFMPSGYGVQRLNSVADDLLKQGIEVTNVVRMFRDAQSSGGVKGETLREIADELKRLASQLPQKD